MSPQRIAALPDLDPHLLSACRSGDREAFHHLFDLYKDRVYSIALRYSGNPATSMDLTQEVFVKLFSRLAGFRGESGFETWLYRLVVNTCLDHRRKFRRLVPLLTEVIRHLQVNESVTSRLIRSQARGEVRAAIDRLDPELRMTVVLRYTEGLSYEEIAEAMTCSRGTVASRLHRAHRLLARRLSHLDGAEFFDV